MTSAIDCPEGQYDNAGTCTNCMSDCQVCTNGTACVTCKNTFFYNTTSTACEDCEINCKTCTNATTCSECEPNFHLEDHMCIFYDCPDG
jgi:hypothetical protein